MRPAALRPVRQEMKDHRLIAGFFLGALGAVGLYFAGRGSYLLSNALAGLAVVFAAWAVVIVVAAARKFEEQPYFLLVGTAFFFAGLLDLAVILISEPVGIVAGFGANTAAQLSIAARSLQALCLLVAPLFVTKNIRAPILFPAGLFVTGLLSASIVVWEVFPVCLAAGARATTFKVAADFVIVFLFGASILTTVINRRFFDAGVLPLLSLSLIAATAWALVLALAADSSGFLALFGRLLAIASFYLMYRAAVRAALDKPYTTLVGNLRQNRQTQRVLLNAARNRAILLSIGGTIVALNDRAAADFEAAPEDLIGKDMYDLMAPGLVRDIRTAADSAVEARQPVQLEQDIGGRCFETGIYPVLDSEGAVLQLAVYSDEITERKKMERELIRLSITDNLTGLFNQRHFVKRIREETDRAHRLNYPLCLVIFDVDNFKHYNDLHGHLKGDQILRTIGDITQRSIRNGVDGAFRYGGDEFALILPYADPVMAENIVKRISIKVAQRTRGVTITYGVSHLADDISVDDLITSADGVMYEKKHEMRHRKVVG